MRHYWVNKMSPESKNRLSLSLKKLKTLHPKPNGFTIVELLIVIVIIGILAALVIVAYNGIQTRARNTSRIASAKGVQKLVNAYVAQEGKYPYLSGHACLGNGYTDWNGDGSPDCYQSNAPYNPAPALDSELKKIAVIPQVETSDVKATSVGLLFRGYLYTINQTIGGVAGRVGVYYFLDGTNQDCGLPGQLSNVSGGTASNGASNNIGNYFGNTRCFVAIDQP